MSQSKKGKTRYFSADFETTVYKGQTCTEVWAAACVELFTEHVEIFHSIEEQFNYFISLDCPIVAYYHNLKFDGNFWLYFLLVTKHFKQASRQLSDKLGDIEWLKKQDMPNNSFQYSISDMGQWYTILIKANNHFIELRDSLKLLPFSVKRIGDAFKTKHRKLEMEYTGVRYAGCEITEQEKEYIANDVLVVKEALEIMFEEGHQKLTIGSCCLDEFKKITNTTVKSTLNYDELFPDLTQIPLDKQYKYTDVDAYIRKSYKGGWCYLVEHKANQIITNGTTADVNSLYPSVMSSESGNYYPIGKPTFWQGNYIPDEAYTNNHYFFVRVKTRFYLKQDMLPFIQIKGNYLYKGTEALKSSDVYDPKTKQYYTYYTDLDGNKHDTRVEMTLTCTDYKLFREHYNVVEFEILDGCWFYTQIGIFDEYMEKYKQQKLMYTGALRELAKLFLNNLYGKMASSTDSSFKYAVVKDDGTIGFIPVVAHNKKAGYIPVGSAITSYARNFTIRAAQKNYHGVGKRGFIYADTDSIHCDLAPNEIQGITVHDKNFCCWKLEACWDKAIFTRQKTYIEHVTHENCEPIEHPYNNIKCAGMPQRCKDLFELSLNGTATEKDVHSEEEKEFLFDTDTGKPIIRTFSDFKVGLKVPSKLRPKRIIGGVLLVETSYEMR